MTDAIDKSKRGVQVLPDMLALFASTADLGAVASHEAQSAVERPEVNGEMRSCLRPRVGQVNMSQRYLRTSANVSN